MENNNNYSGLTNLQSLTKVIQLELKPVGKTRENIEKYGVIEEALTKKEKSSVVKDLMDKYYRSYINKNLQSLILDVDNYADAYFNPDTSDHDIDSEASKLRETIYSHMSSDEDFKSLFSAKIFNIISSPSMPKTDEEADALAEFKGFTTSFGRYFTARKTIFSLSTAGTTLTGRIVDDNLPKYLDNCHVVNLLDAAGVIDLGLIEQDFKAILDGIDIDSLFDPHAYSQFVSDDAIYLYNTTIGGLSVDGRERIQGINERINVYNQQHKTRFPLLKQLYLQILSEHRTLSFVPQKIENDSELRTLLKDATEKLSPVVSEDGSLTDLLSDISSYDLDRIYIDAGDISNIAYDSTGNWRLINLALEHEFDARYPKKAANKDEKYFAALEKYQKKEKFYSVTRINSLVTAYTGEEFHIESYLKSPYKRSRNKEDPDAREVNFAHLFDDATAKAYTLINSHSTDANALLKDKAENIKIKQLLEPANDFAHLVKRLLAVRASDKDEVFYSLLAEEYEKISFITSVYRKAETYLTRKPYSLDSLPLYFGNPQLLNGWSASVESDKGGIILRRQDPDKPGQMAYYLGILRRGTKLARTSIVPPDECNDENAYEKMFLSYLGDPAKYIPKNLIGAASFEKEYGPVPEEIKMIAREKTHKLKSPGYKREDLDKLIDYSKHALSIYKPTMRYGFAFKETSEYGTWEDFCSDVAQQGYSVYFERVSAELIDSAVEEGSLFLFRVWHRKMRPGANDRLDEQLAMFYGCFSDTNTESGTVYKLSAGATVSYRPASLDINKTAVHKTGDIVKRKNPVNGKDTSVMKRDIYKNYNRTREMFVINLPIELNYGADTNSIINELANERLRKDSFNVIGIKRGKENLIQATVLDPDGCILEARSLNVLGDSTNPQDYHRLLKEREKQTKSERQTWTDISSLANLKSSYSAQAVGVISSMMTKYNAIVILEDLNSREKNTGEIEDAVYKHFEMQLISKLSYKVVKDNPDTDDGGIYHAYQLTYKPTSQKRTGRQVGFILFTSPAYTDVDPVTGFTNHAFIAYKNMEQAKDLIRSFESIEYIKSENLFLFRTDFRRFTAREIGSKTAWDVYSYGARTKKSKFQDNTIHYKEIDVTNNMAALLASKQISLDSGNLIENICSIDDADFFRRFLELLRLMFQMRNECESGSFFVSPVKNSSGKFFDTRKFNKNLPSNPDAIGSYNMARKGRILLDRIKNSDGAMPDLFLSYDQWLDAVSL